jgi:hypothetical protein
MTVLASAIHISGVVKKNFPVSYLLDLLKEVNEDLCIRRDYSVDVDALILGLSEYLVDRIDMRLVELMGSDWLTEDWSFVDAGQSLLWDQFAWEVGAVSALEQLSAFVGEFTEVCSLSSVSGSLIVEYVGPADLPYDGYDLNPERIHGLTALAA